MVQAMIWISDRMPLRRNVTSGWVDERTGGWMSEWMIKVFVHVKKRWQNAQCQKKKKKFNILRENRRISPGNRSQSSLVTAIDGSRWGLQAWFGRLDCKKGSIGCEWRSNGWVLKWTWPWPWLWPQGDSDDHGHGWGPFLGPCQPASFFFFFLEPFWIASAQRRQLSLAVSNRLVGRPCKLFAALFACLGLCCCVWCVVCGVCADLPVLWFGCISALQRRRGARARLSADSRTFLLTAGCTPGLDLIGSWWFGWLALLPWLHAWMLPCFHASMHPFHSIPIFFSIHPLPLILSILSIPSIPSLGILCCCLATILRANMRNRDTMHRPSFSQTSSLYRLIGFLQSMPSCWSLRLIDWLVLGLFHYSIQFV